MVIYEKNCYNCKHLETDDGEDEYGEGGGFYCEKRDCCNCIQLETNINNHAYRKKSKRCCDLKGDI